MRFVQYYWQYFLIGIKNGLEYRYYFISSVVASFFEVFFAFFLWAFIFGLGYTEIAGLTFTDYFIYFLLSGFINRFFHSVHDSFENDVIDGNLLQHIIRNINPFPAYYFLRFGNALFNILIYSVFLISAIVYYNKFAFFSFLLFLVFLILAILLFFIIYSLYGLLAVKVQRITSFDGIFTFLIMFVSGGIIPLTFFPDLFQQILYYLPFQYMKFFPIMVYLGKVTTFQIILGFVVSIGWLIILFLLWRVLYKVALRCFEAQGG